MKSLNVVSPATESVLAKELVTLQRTRALNRRGFLSGIGMAGLATTGAALLSGCSGMNSTVMAASPSQQDILNFALNLEFLEATFYSYITTGQDIASSLIGGGPAPMNVPAQITFPNQIITDVMNEIAYDEISHVADLRSILGSSAVARPQLSLNALGAVSVGNVFNISRTFEDVGVTAYAGATASLTGTNLAAAVQIVAVEAFHASVLRFLYISLGDTGTKAADTIDVVPADPGAMALATNGPTQASGGFFATVGNSNANPGQGLLPGFAYTRTPAQVLQIAYGTGTTGSTQGGFFPNGLNGNIKVS